MMLGLGIWRSLCGGLLVVDGDIRIVRMGYGVGVLDAWCRRHIVG
jgi:hypothetical protein